MAEKDIKELADRTERMVKRMEELLAAFGIKLQPSHAEDPSSPEVNRAEEQPTKETSPSPLENLPELQPFQRNTNPTTKQRSRNHHRSKERPTPTISTNTTTYQPIGTNTIPTQNSSQSPEKRHLLANTGSSAPTITSKNSTKFTNQQVNPSPTVSIPETSKPSHPLHEFINPASPIPQDYSLLTTNQKTHPHS
jgi:hypothetical protein